MIKKNDLEIIKIGFLIALQDEIKKRIALKARYIHCVFIVLYPIVPLQWQENVDSAYCRKKHIVLQHSMQCFSFFLFQSEFFEVQFAKFESVLVSFLEYIAKTFKNLYALEEFSFCFRTESHLWRT